MKITLLTAGKMKHPFFADAEKEFFHRIRKFCAFQSVEIAEEKLTKATNATQAKKKEAQRFAKKLPINAFLIAIDERGREFSAEDFSRFLQTSFQNNNHLVFLIGGANGLHSSLIHKSQHTLALGKMTLTQDLARVVFLESLFRGFTIWKHLPFHR